MDPKLKYGKLAKPSLTPTNTVNSLNKPKVTVVGKQSTNGTKYTNDANTVLARIKNSSVLDSKTFKKNEHVTPFQTMALSKRQEIISSKTLPSERAKILSKDIPPQTVSEAEYTSHLADGAISDESDDEEYFSIEDLNKDISGRILEIRRSSYNINIDESISPINHVESNNTEDYSKYIDSLMIEDTFEDDMIDVNNDTRKRRLPKFIPKPNLSKPRELTEIPDELPSPQWPSFIKTVLNYPNLVNYPPKAKEFLLPKSEPTVKSTPENPDTFTPIVVYEAKYGIDSPIITKPEQDTEDALRFESRFECGNLYKATRVGPTHYQLEVRKDVNTKGHTQWYFFKIENMKPDTLYRFEIVNLMKKDSLYNLGLRPLMYSEVEAKRSGTGWHRVGHDIVYFKNPPDPDEEEPPARPPHTLSFTLSIPHDKDIIYLAHCYPYSYTDLHNDIASLKADLVRSKLFRHTVLCKTLGGNNIDLITITTPVLTPEDLVSRKAIILSSRVHPGETNSSWMMRGLLQYLTSDKEEAKYLRDHFVIKIIPMLNPDGVIVGNYRCNLTGYDLNRKWGNADSDWAKEHVPEIYGIRDLIQRSSQSREVVFFCDLHGHNRKNGIFMYGCHNDKPESYVSHSAPPSRQGSTCSRSKITKEDVIHGGSDDEDEGSDKNSNEKESVSDDLDGKHAGNTKRYKERVFPLMLSRNAKDLFYFKRCQFRMQKSKQGTGRITVRKAFGVLNSFTLEASFCGSDEALGGRGFHFTIADLEEMGESVGKTLYEYFCEDGKAAESVFKELVEGFQVGNKSIEPDSSDSSETTSDDEKLIIRSVKKKKKVLTKRKSILQDKSQFVKSIDTAPIPATLPRRSTNASANASIKSNVITPMEKNTQSKEPLKLSQVKVVHKPHTIHTIESGRPHIPDYSYSTNDDSQRQSVNKNAPPKSINPIFLQLDPKSDHLIHEISNSMTDASGRIYLTKQASAPPPTPDHYIHGPGQIGSGIMVNLVTHSHPGALLVSARHQTGMNSHTLRNELLKYSSSTSSASSSSSQQYGKTQHRKKSTVDMDRLYCRIPHAGRGGASGWRSDTDHLQPKSTKPHYTTTRSNTRHPQSSSTSTGGGGGVARPKSASVVAHDNILSLMMSSSASEVKDGNAKSQFGSTSRMAMNEGGGMRSGSGSSGLRRRPLSASVELVYRK